MIPRTLEAKNIKAGFDANIAMKAKAPTVAVTTVY
jgi:hypothetical protein